MKNKSKSTKKKSKILKERWVCNCKACECDSDCQCPTGFIIDPKFRICASCGGKKSLRMTKIRISQIANPHDLSKESLIDFKKSLYPKEPKTTDKFFDKVENAKLIKRINKELELSTDFN